MFRVRPYLASWWPYVLVFTLIGFAVAAQLYVSRTAVQSAETARLKDISRYMDESLHRQLLGVYSAMSRVADEYRDSRLGSAESSRQISLLAESIHAVSGITVYDANGTSVASDSPANLGQDFFNAEHFSLAYRDPQDNRIHLSRPMRQDDSTVVLKVSRAIQDHDGALIGVVAATLDEDFFALFIRSALSTADMRATLAHADGQVFVTVPSGPRALPPNVLTPGSAFEEHVSSGRETTVFEGLVQATGLQRLLVLTKVQPEAMGLDKPLVLAVSRDRGAVYAAWNAELRLYLAMYLLTLMLAAVVKLIVQDKRKRLQEAEQAAQAVLRLTASRLERALDGANLGLWELDVAKQEMHVDARGASILGCGRSEIVKTADDWTQTLHPADRQRNIQAFRAHLSGQSDSYECEFRVLTPGDGYRWLLSKGKTTQHAPDGRPLRVIGTFMDTTARKADEEALKEAAALLKRAGDIARIGGWTVDVATGKTKWTEEVYRIHELDMSEAPDLSSAISYYTEECRPLIENAVMNGRAKGTPWDLELQIVTAKGRLAWVRAQGEAVYEDGKIVQLAGAFQDITERKLASIELERLNLSLAELSYTDALTGLGNRRLFDDTLAAEWARCSRQGTPLSLLMIDVDYFKRYNDQHGHPGGDACLRQVATVLRDALWRSHERAFRYGGEEFAVLLPDASLDGAEHVAGRVIAAMATAAIPHGSSSVSEHVTLSIGVGTARPAPGTATQSLIKASDEALYDAKAGGRARYAVGEISPVTP